MTVVRTQKSKANRGSARTTVAAKRDNHGPRAYGAPQLAAAAGGAQMRQQIAELQTSVGNQAILRMLSRSGSKIQSRLKVNEPGDKHEQQADRVADQVVNGFVAIDRKPSNAAHAAPSVTNGSLSNLGPGQPLDTHTRDFMESRFARDFSRVRVHTGSPASGSASALGANAYTLGHDIVFGAGRYQPNTAPGKRLVAHELTHVLQQQAAA